MARRPVPFAIQYGKGRSAKSTVETLVNLYAEQAPTSSKTAVRLIGTPGTRLAATLEGNRLLGLHNMGGVLYAVTNRAAYSIAEDGTATFISYVGPVGRVSMADNGTQLVFVDGIRGYVIEAGVLTQITDSNFKPADRVSFIDGYFVFNETGTGRIFISGLYALTFDALEFTTAEANPDNVVSIIASHREIWAFGAVSVEPFYNSGDADFPFARISGATIDHGCASPHSVAQGDNSVFWLGNDGIVYRAIGYAPQRISTHEVETAIKGQDKSTAFAFFYSDEGHNFLVLTFSRGTFVFDVATGLWHTRQHVDYTRHHANCYAFCYDKHWIGHFDEPEVLEMNLDLFTDADRPVLSVAIAPPIQSNRDPLFFGSYEVDMDVGNGLAHGSGSDPKALLSWSDDGGKTWSNEREASIGKMGRFGARVIWRRLGRSRERSFKVAISDPVKRVIQGIGYVELG